jgi:transposase-like protein
MSNEAATVAPPALPATTEQKTRKPRRSDDEKAKHIEACKDLNTKGVEQYAKDHGLSQYTLRSWIIKAGKPKAKRGPGRPPKAEGAKRGRGRPKGSTNKAKRGPGRPPKAEGAKRGRGRPKGSTNKVEVHTVTTQIPLTSEFSVHCKETIKEMIVGNTTAMLEGRQTLPAAALEALNTAYRAL